MEQPGLPSAHASPDSDARLLQRLIERIRRGTCVLVVGPGVAVDPHDPNRTPLTCALSRQLAADSEVKLRCPNVDPDNLRQVAEVFYDARRDRDELEMTVADFYKHYEESTTDFHIMLAELPFKLCICTTPDKLLSNAFNAVAAKNGTGRKTPVVAHYSFSQRSARPLPMPTELKPIIYHLYGHIDEPDSLVLTENDLIEFLVRVVEDRQSVPDMIRGQLGDQETTFLFVGFGFLNWYVRVLLHVLKIYGHKNRPLALEDRSFFSHPEHTQVVMFFTGNRSIEFRPFTWTDFAKQLRDSYFAGAKSSTAAEPKPPPGAPRVFLCYASDDRDAVEQLAARLQSSGIEVWQDKQNLRAGENWDRVLIAVIQKQVNYVVVCQSVAMDHRVKGYYHKEIEMALEEQRQHRPDLRFVIAVKLEDCEGHEKLTHLHSINVQTESGAQALVISILEDWKHRPVNAAAPTP
jgi:hypothetical protein